MPSSGAAAMKDCVVSEREAALRFWPKDKKQLIWEQSFIGKSGIKIRLRLSSTLQPANWLAESDLPPFVSCLNNGKDAAQQRQLARRIMQGTGSPSRDGGGSWETGLSPRRPGLKRSLRSSSSSAQSSSGVYGSGGGGYSETMGRENLEKTEDLYKTTLAMEQQTLSETEWMSGILVDAILFQLAKAYRNVNYMPVMFCSNELPAAARAGPAALRALRPRDMLGREICVVPDALSPVTEIEGYSPLPTHYPRDSYVAAVPTPRATPRSSSSSLPLQVVPPGPWGSSLVVGHLPGGSLYTPPAYTSANPSLVFLCNTGQVHWTVIRVDLGMRKRIELYEPFGLDSNGKGRAARARLDKMHNGGGEGGGGSYAKEGLSLRNLPKDLVTWLDTVCPLPSEGGWRAQSASAITWQHQGNGFDCGVACLLYAEKIGQGLEAETICEHTDQQEISEHRAVLRSFLPRFMAENLL